VLAGCTAHILALELLKADHALRGEGSAKIVTPALQAPTIKKWGVGNAEQIMHCRGRQYVNTG
jgi:hypothetical protein